MKHNISIYISIIAILLFASFGMLLVQDRQNNPEQVFYDMLANNLNSRGVSRTVTQNSSSQSLVQTLQIQTGARNAVHGQTVLSQESGDEKTTILTESIATLTDDNSDTQEFIRYTNIDTPELSSSGQSFDFSGIIGVWGQSDQDESLKRGGELFGEATLGIVPFAKLGSEQRKQIVNLIRELDVYAIDFTDVARAEASGRQVYVYQAQIKPERYVSMLQKFAAQIGMTQLESLEPKDFENNPPINVTFEVDIRSRQLRTVSFEDSDRSETYTAYGLIENVSAPSESIPTSELQQRLQSIQ